VKNWARYSGFVAAGVLGMGVMTSGFASAQPSTTTAASAACQINVGSVTAGGDHRMQTFSATGAKVADKIVAKDIYPDGSVRLSATQQYGPSIRRTDFHSGSAILGEAFYESTYRTPPGGGTPVTEKALTRIGGGWLYYRSLDTSYVDIASGSRETDYALRADGTIERRSVTIVNGAPLRRVTGWQSGYKGVKAMTLISQTPTYDTFLMTLTTGKLYTARLPIAGGQIIPGVVKQVRGSTWQGFESLVAAPCGTGTLLLGIDKDSGSGFLYSVGHANGTATVIRSIGKVPGTFKDPAYFVWKGFTEANLAGE
jgi:hypothetical protein